MATAVPSGADVEYPDSDGMPMADDTLQYAWIVTLKGNLDLLLRDRPDVFEVWSPGNRAGGMKRKRAFYRTYGAEEYYLLDPEDDTVEAWVRDGDAFREVPDTDGWVSPLLGSRFTTSPELAVHYPDGRRFLTFAELGQRAEQAERDVEQARGEVDRMRALLRAAGVDPDRPPAG